jgi:hypothetical protein
MAGQDNFAADDHLAIDEATVISVFEVAPSHSFILFVGYDNS